MGADVDLPDLRDDGPRWVRCAVDTRQSVKRLGDDPAVIACAIQRTLCTEFNRGKTWNDCYPTAELFERHRVHLTIVDGNINRCRLARWVASEHVRDPR